MPWEYGSSFCSFISASATLNQKMMISEHLGCTGEGLEIPHWHTVAFPPWVWCGFKTTCSDYRLWMQRMRSEHRTLGITVATPHLYAWASSYSEPNSLSGPGPPGDALSGPPFHFSCHFFLPSNFFLFVCLCFF